MKKITLALALATVRSAAANNGMTFKVQDTRIDGIQLYKFINRKSGKILSENFTIWSAYDYYLTGRIEKLIK